MKELDLLLELLDFFAFFLRGRLEFIDSCAQIVLVELRVLKGDIGEVLGCLRNQVSLDFLLRQF